MENKQYTTRELFRRFAPYFKKYRFKRLKGFLVYHRLSVLIFIFYEVKFFLMKQLTNK